MPSIEALLAVRDRLQAGENRLIAAGWRNIEVDCTAGVFTWVQRGAGREPHRQVSFADDLQEIEGMIASDVRDSLVVMTQFGTFTWRPHRRG
jgi:hypothetical protein